MFIILQDNSTEIIYWQEYNQNLISRTHKNYKLDIPNENILNKLTKQKIIDIIFKYQYFKLPTTLYPASIREYKEDKLIIYFSNSHGAKDTLHLNIEYKKDIIALDLFYKVKKKEWDREKSFLAWESQYHYSLFDFKKYIQQLFDTTNKSKLAFNKLGTDIEIIINGNIDNVQEFIFDFNNKNNDIPKYSDFLKAFELHSNLNRQQYEAQSIDTIILYKLRRKFLKLALIKVLLNN